MSGQKYSYKTVFGNKYMCSIWWRGWKTNKIDESIFSDTFFKIWTYFSLKLQNYKTGIKIVGKKMYEKKTFKKINLKFPAENYSWSDRKTAR